MDVKEAWHIVEQKNEDDEPIAIVELKHYFSFWLVRKGMYCASSSLASILVNKSTGKMVSAAINDPRIAQKRIIRRIDPEEVKDKPFHLTYVKMLDYHRK